MSHFLLLLLLLLLALVRPLPAAAQTSFAANPPDFPKALGTAIGVGIASVLILAMVICVFAHCWERLIWHEPSREEWLGSTGRPASPTPVLRSQQSLWSLRRRGSSVGERLSQEEMLTSWV